MGIVNPKVIRSPVGVSQQSPSLSDQCSAVQNTAQNKGRRSRERQKAFPPQKPWQRFPGSSLSQAH